MTLTELFVVAVGLSMDAFAVALCKGLSVGKTTPKHAAITGFYFGGFQAAMPLFGYLLGEYFQGFIISFSHWIAFVLLVLIGANMIKESRSDCQEVNTDFGIKAMLPLAIATSIDALAVGVSFAFLEVQIIPAITFIGITTFVLSAVGVKAGAVFGRKYKSHAEIFGGIVLIIMGCKILLENIGVLAT